MASQLAGKRLVFKLALQVYAIKKTFEVEGEETNEALFLVALSTVHVLAFIGLTSGGVTMRFYEGYVLDFSAVCLAIVAPMVVIQKAKLHRLGELRGQHNFLREKCNVLADENDKLTSTINEMGVQMDR